MRLESIKLSGFKSFVDPTTVHLPSNLAAIVGPNGCGKSNIIDAVRWVMGESSAKHLRGDSMSDVIFNGSTGRKPVGLASIELVFNNADGSLGGEYAKYSEIAIKRQVTRDGQSNYYLNNTRCRRRDITDIFLGTGLGPRSYAIIEQGTISRLIEAKPEELRVYLEEAAGISKYKERRRETELRIQHARENLDRLTDLRDELGRQINHLQRQANAAERYKVLKQEERLLKAQLQALRWQILNKQLSDQTAIIKEQEIQLEALIAKQRSVDTSLERQRQSQIVTNEQFNEVQSRYYKLGAEIARVEQALQHHRSRCQELEADLRQAEIACQEAEQHLAEDQQRSVSLQETKLQLQPATEAAAATLAEAQTALADAGQVMSAWQTRWDDFNQNSAAATQQAQMEQARIQQIEERLLTISQHRARLEEESSKLNPEALARECEQLNQASVQHALESERVQAALQDLAEKMTAQRAQNEQCTAELDNARHELQRLRGRHASLEALQQAALGQAQGAVIDWLKQHQLAEKPRLAQGLRVQDGWDHCVETVLGSYLEAVCVDGLQNATAILESLQKGTLALFDTSTNLRAATTVQASTLLSKVQSSWSLDALLGGIYITETLAEAYALTPSLAAHESVITREGIWLGRGWLRVARDADEKAGVLQRERELADTQVAITGALALVDQKQTNLTAGQSELHRLETERDAKQREYTEFSTKQANSRAELQLHQGKLEQQQQRIAQINTELATYVSQVDQQHTEMNTAKTVWQEALALLEQQSQLRDELMQLRDQSRQQLEAAQKKTQTERELAHQLALQLQTVVAQLEALQQNDARMLRQLESLRERRANLTKMIEENSAPLASLAEQLEKVLSEQSKVEAELALARERLETVEQELRELEKQRTSAESQALQLRSHLEQLRMEWQTVQVRQETVQEQIAEAEYQLETLLNEMPGEANETTWQAELDRVMQKVDRLGPINLAAIDEYASQSERKNYLDAQNDDLVQALAILEEAIGKIDQETRAKFKEAYEKVNGEFQTLFPQIFGGGKAYLELTGENLLDTGVAVMAQPPGKRNSTIHLLSGGEKALTAIALVFGIFQLNPAPFCMLDEVDAPLDDNNVGRFCDLVKNMSKKIQFIFISHNKLAIEMAEHLMGVTMNEPGVSRLVAVDVGEAVALAEA